MILYNRQGKPTSLEQLMTRQNLAIYPGSFNPLHEGHRGIYDLLTAEGFEVVFEISKSRYQKDPYPDGVIEALAKQFCGFAEVLISDAPLFSQKRDQLLRFSPYWVMGFDTAKRWIDENRQADREEWKRINAMKVIFIGRLSRGVYHDPQTLLSGKEEFEIKTFPFHCDISSTEIRNSANLASSRS